MRLRLFLFILAATLFVSGSAFCWWQVIHLIMAPATKPDLSELTPKLAGHYRYGGHAHGGKTLPRQPEILLEADGRCRMIDVPAIWLEYPGTPVLNCSGAWQPGDDGDGSLTLEFTLTDIDGVAVHHFVHARAMQDGFYFESSGADFLAIKNAADAPPPAK
jgi:hypothetical protein